MADFLIVEFFLDFLNLIIKVNLSTIIFFSDSLLSELQI